MREATLQKKIKADLEEAGWLVFKLSTPGQTGVPDLLIMRGGCFEFIEIKTTGGKLSPKQKWWHEQLNQKTSRVVIVILSLEHWNELKDQIL